MFKLKIRSRFLKTIATRVLIPFFIMILLFVVFLLVLPMRSRIMLTGGFIWSFIKCPLDSNETICLTQPLFATTIYENGPPERTFVFTFIKETDLEIAREYIVERLINKGWDLRAVNIKFQSFAHHEDENTTYRFFISKDRKKLMEMKLQKTYSPFSDRADIEGELNIGPNLLYPEDPPQIVIDLTESE